jgi:hypothetical protein
VQEDKLLCDSWPPSGTGKTVAMVFPCPAASVCYPAQLEPLSAGHASSGGGASGDEHQLFRLLYSIAKKKNRYSTGTVIFPPRFHVCIHDRGALP